MQNATNKEISQPDGRFKVGCPDGDVTVADKRVDRFQCLLRTVPAAEWAGVGQRERSCARREAWGSRSFRAARRVVVDRFQCLLRPVPAAEWAGVGQR
jgi:hypothetical protein